MRTQTALISGFAIFRSKVKSILFSQSTANFCIAYSFIAVRNKIAIIIYPIEYQMTMRMFRVVMPGYDILSIANPHLFHPFLGNLHHKFISFFVIGKTANVLRRESKRYVLYRTLYFRAHGCLKAKRIGNQLIANGTYSFVRQKCSAFLLVLLVVGIVYNTSEINSCFNLRYHDRYSLLG